MGDRPATFSASGDESAAVAPNVAVWTIDGTLRLLAVYGDSIGDGAVQSADYVGRNLPELLEALKLPAVVLASHRQALSGQIVHYQAPLGEVYRRFRSQPIRDSSEQIVGCLTVISLSGHFGSPYSEPDDTQAASQDDSDSEQNSTISGHDAMVIAPVWHSILEAACEYALMLDRSGVVREIMHARGDVDPATIVGRSILALTPKTTRGVLEQKLRAVARHGSILAHEFSIVARNGRTRHYDARIGPIHENDTVSGLIMVANDVTERRETEHQLVAEEALLRRLLDLQDRERRLVAYEVHDGLLQDIVAAQMLLQTIRTRTTYMNASQVRRLDEAQRLILNAINEGRRLISQLRPMIIDELGLVKAIEYLVSEEDARGLIRIAFSHRVSFDRLPSLMESTLFRIVQEAINNAKRHSQADLVDIRLTQIDRRFVILEIYDQGIGFDPEAVLDNHFGLEGIRERARLFGGGATIESAPGQGTRITVRLPFDNSDHESTTDAPKIRWTI